MGLVDKDRVIRRIPRRIFMNKVQKWIFALSTGFGILVLAVLLVRILSQGLQYLDWQFVISMPSRFVEQAGMLPAIVGSLWLMAVTVPVSFVLGVGAAIYLEEYAKKSRFNRLVQVNISNLAGVPSIVFGLLGLTIFVQAMQMGQSILAGGLTLSLLILPIIVVAAQEAIRSVPKELREASYGMGATKWQTIRRIVLPAALPGILTGSILAFSRAIGETAPLIMVGALTYVAFLPTGLFSSFTAMPIQIFNWTSLPQKEFHQLAAAGIIVLLIVLILLNSVAVLIRNKFQKRY